MINKSNKLIMIISLFAVIIVILSGFYFVYSNLQPVYIEESVEIEIPHGTNVSEIANILKEEDLIRNSFIFEIYARYKGIADSFQAGIYEFEGKVTPDNLATKLKVGEVVDKSIRVTIPEGLRADQVAELLEIRGLGEKESYLALFNSPEKFDHWFLDEFDFRDSVKFSLEGFLFPETYNIREDSTEREVVKKLLDQFDSVFTDEFKEKKSKLELNLNIVELITIASIVEREAVADKERRKIAGVFFNRLNEGIKLEACATVEYVLRENKPRLSLEDTRIESEYNTYMHEGLPPGPIASPGKKSIEAVIDPESHEYYFFVAREDGSGKHYFSKTLEEHNRARERVRSD